MTELDNLSSRLSGLKVLEGVTVYRSGDALQHRKTGRTYTVAFVKIAGYRLDVATEEGAIFNESEVRKI